MPDRSAYNDSTLVIGLGRFGSAVAATLDPPTTCGRCW